MTVTLDQPLELPCGATLKNRLGKSAMSETLGTTDNRVTAKLTRLYRAWARGGTGLSVTGNVMIDRRALGEPCNVVLEDRRDMDRLKAWARAGRENGTHLWMQINHPGKQAPAALNRETVSPSAVPFSDPNLKRFFHVPRALTVAEIEDLVRRFGETAALAKEAGFTACRSTAPTVIWSASSCRRATTAARTPTAAAPKTGAASCWRSTTRSAAG